MPPRATRPATAASTVSGREIYERARKEGFLIRHFDIPGIADFVRITVGLPEDMARLLEVLKAIP